MNKAKLLNSKLLLIVILVLFLFTRLYKIGEIPLSVYWDEASIGYNAYSIAQTGKDEWGKFFPIHFRAFGEFKLPVYIYSVVPFVKIFGLNAFSVRLPAVLYSLGIIVLVFFLAKKISGSRTVGIFSSFFITISPWFFIFSRTGYEATAGLTFYLLGIYLFLFDKWSWYILFSVISFILSAYSYNSFRIIIPLTLPVLFFSELNKLKQVKIVPVILSVLILSLSFIPIYRLYKYDNGASRLQVVAAAPQAFLKNYYSHFDPKFLFISGDKNLRSQQMGFGELYLPELMLLPLGLLYLIKSKSKYKLLPIILLILGPIPAAITKESPHSLRAISMAPFISVISAVGAVAFGVWIKKTLIINTVIGLIFLAFFANYFLNFVNIYPVQSAKDWQYDYKKIFTDPKLQLVTSDRVLISDKDGQPYIFALFYLNYNPEKFRQEVVRNSVDKWGFSTVKSFGKFEFGQIKN
ncbi:hypothetical protein A3H40_04095 [Candidatus Daviesbacteria bacterium RIFCSPLOWO2_02_FULL_38_15]|uniref:Glycosyltransferase RgtA/B/C/D-like domain-containing protein n=1 Tax=Candidatus Daviesbacteria bacterium RIFCSPLOWO2_02_FULL_38_15 TaxID=1797794 RepID=A0A1F5N455_9BACT|nr:MAG: hypothetical protein A3H40_04095 [Candidatus Daviesbacteria bacterium RIFCSPLOWO2_02_FULL_38_15]